MIRALYALTKRVFFGPVLPDYDDRLALARMYGELTKDFIDRQDDSNVYVLAVRAFHHARKYQEDREP
jgi:hypothetical protein